MKKFLICFFLIVFFTTNAQQTIPVTLLEGNFLGDSYPRNILKFKGDIYFTAEDGIHGKELWRISDNVPNLVGDIIEGEDGAFDGNYQEKFLVTEDNLYFTTHEGKELWSTDGIDVSQKVSFSYDYPINNLCKFNSNIYFTYYDSVNGDEIWTYNELTGDYHLFLDINPGVSSSSAESLFVFNDKMYFVAKGPSGREIWMTDGTVEGTELLKDINPNGDSILTFSHFIVLENMFFFYAWSQIMDMNFGKVMVLLKEQH